MCPDWLDRMLLILALAYWIWLAVALVALQRYSPGMWCSSNRQGTCSLFFIGRQMIERMQVRAAEALNALLGALFSESQTGDDSGQITGSVRFTGTIPPPRRVETNDGTTIEIADLRVDPQTKGLAEVLVFVENPPLTKSPPPRQAAVIDQVNWLFRPRVVGVVAGQEVRFENNDTCNHSVQTQSSNPTNQINAAAGPGVPIIHRFEAQRDPIPVSCALHPWMRAYLFVSPHPFFAVTDERGEFALPKLPPGEYRLRWLHPISRLQTHREVTVAAQTTARLNIVWDRLPDSQ